MPRNEVRGVRGNYVKDALSSCSDQADDKMRHAIELSARAEMMETAAKNCKPGTPKAETDRLLMEAENHRKAAESLRKEATDIQIVVRATGAYEAMPTEVQFVENRKPPTHETEKREVLKVTQQMIEGTVPKKDKELFDLAQAWEKAKSRKKAAGVTEREAYDSLLKAVRRRIEKEGIADMNLRIFGYSFELGVEDTLKITSIEDNDEKKSEKAE